MDTAIRNARRKGKPRRQPRPGGPFYPVDAAWKSAVKAALERCGLSQAELARRIGASPGSIVLILKDDTVQSRLVPAIHQALGLEPPTTTTAVKAS